MPKDDNERTLEADGLRVVFFRHGDRIAHRIEVVDPNTNDWLPALISVEGSPDDPWPASPPFQQLHVEQRPTGPIVFLIGMAGRSHWSAAVDIAADRRSIRFDVAVRLQTKPEKLGNRYESPDSKLAVEFLGSTVPDLPKQVPATVSWNYAVSAR
ncbi:MAG: hypothetical protein JNK76_19000 [Planctomycetales bacterium]|nr:hypothetical protein [Planctomycetales bacterium]MBN8628223.1 hypothetical protein [Planctomycetota bacterium]